MVHIPPLMPEKQLKETTGNEMATMFVQAVQYGSLTPRAPLYFLVG